MTTHTILPAGFIVANNEAIWGAGATADQAWSDFRRVMDSASTVILSDADDIGDQLGSWTRQSDYRICSASAALLADVEARGGNISWERVGGVCCTPDEAAES